jgi:hypothetical protein
VNLGGGDMESGPTIQGFFERLGFKTKERGEVVAAKVFERDDKASITRAWIEIYRGEKHYSVVLGLSTRDIEDVKYLVEVLNNVLEEFAYMKGYKRVV